MTQRGDVVRQRILAAIAQLWEERGYNPTIDEIAAAVGKSHSATYNHLTLLRDEGKVRLDRRFSGWRLA